MHQREKMRLSLYDYASAGAYFVTVCVKDRKHVFGDVVKGQMQLNHHGRMVAEAWNELPTRFINAHIDEFVIMPNHIHGIIVLSNGGMGRNDAHARRGAIHGAPTLGDIVRTLKAVSTHRIRLSGFSEFCWQRNYYDHIIRNEDTLNETRQYIATNPLRWDLDPENKS